MAQAFLAPNIAAFFSVPKAKAHDLLWSKGAGRKRIVDRDLGHLLRIFPVVDIKKDGHVPGILRIHQRRQWLLGSLGSVFSFSSNTPTDKKSSGVALSLDRNSQLLRVSLERATGGNEDELTSYRVTPVRTSSSANLEIIRSFSSVTGALKNRGKAYLMPPIFFQRRQRRKLYL